MCPLIVNNLLILDFRENAKLFTGFFSLLLIKVFYPIESADIISQSKSQ